MIEDVTKSKEWQANQLKHIFDKYYCPGIKWRTYVNPQRTDGLFVAEDKKIAPYPGVFRSDGSPICPPTPETEHSLPYQLPHAQAEELVRMLNSGSCKTSVEITEGGTVMQKLACFVVGVVVGAVLLFVLLGFMGVEFSKRPAVKEVTNNGQVIIPSTSPAPLGVDSNIVDLRKQVEVINQQLANINAGVGELSRCAQVADVGIGTEMIVLSRAMSNYVGAEKWAKQMAKAREALAAEFKARQEEEARKAAQPLKK